MSTKTETIYVPLLEEGIAVWRPVLARRISGDSYRILDQDYDRDVETWEFEPGAVVKWREEERGGRRILSRVLRRAAAWRADRRTRPGDPSDPSAPAAALPILSDVEPGGLMGGGHADLRLSLREM